MMHIEKVDLIRHDFDDLEVDEVLVVSDLIFEILI
jgi:hypothetical protein